MIPRLLAILAMALVLAPNPYARRERPREIVTQLVTVRAVPIPQTRVGEVTVREAWHIASANSQFGGFSGLVLERPRQFLVASDFGSLLRLRLARDGTVAASRLWPVPLAARYANKSGRDLEALVVDPQKGTIWAAFEQNHRIVRFTPGMTMPDGQVRPPAMLDWNVNGGAEAMARLADGRFIALAETSGGPGGGTDALLFARDPVEKPHAAPLRFALDPGERGRVTDAAPLPDGRVLLLFRKIGLGGWTSTLAVADPRTIRGGAMWQSRTIARFGEGQLPENYEGLAIDPAAEPGGPVTIWMLSDDNRTGWQRTLLLRLSWVPSP